MKNFSYKTIRKVTFAVYLIITIIFCSLIIHYGQKEIQQAKQYALNEKKYFDSLLSCRNLLNDVDNAYIKYLKTPSPTNLNNLTQSCIRFRTISKHLVSIEKVRKSLLTETAKEIFSSAQKLLSICYSIKADGDAHFTEQQILIDEDIYNSTEILDFTRHKLQSLLRTEFDHVEIWQKQSVYFYNRLQYLVVSFFILTTVFTVAASTLFSYILNIFLIKLKTGTQEISSGNLKYRFPNPDNDELGMLMNDFNQMAAKLEKQTETIFKANTELQNKTEELIEANQHKDRFMANMSHELRTPLNSVIGFADLMLNRAQNFKTEKIKGYSQKILNAAEHLLSLISDLLNVAKVDAGVLKPVFSSFNLSTVIEDTLDMLKPLAEKKDLNLTGSYDDNLELEGDKKFILQVLINIINNAIKFTHHGNITVNSYYQNDDVIIEIIDTGIGISPQDQQLIFKDFHRIESGLTSNYDGVGLGLTLSKRLIELHKGCIIVSSKMKKGTTFTIKIPKKQNEEIR